MRALGTIVSVYEGMDPATSVCCGFLDYYDHWSEVDERLSAHHEPLSRASAVFGHDLVNIATYTHEVLRWVDPENMRLAPSVVCVGGMTEALIVSVRSAYDAVALGLSYAATEKPNQAPTDSLNSLVNWAAKHEGRVGAEVRDLLLKENSEFCRVRSFRDNIVHQGASSTIHCDNWQFNLWLYGRNGWITREPLLPFLAIQIRALLSFADEAATVINAAIGLPIDRIGSRAIEGVLINSLHRLQTIETHYARQSP